MEPFSFTHMIYELQMIEEVFDDFTKDPYTYFDMEVFNQWWVSTAGGFDNEIGGASMTRQRTYVFIPMVEPKNGEYTCLVFFGARFAYYANYRNEEFRFNLVHQDLLPVSQKERYQATNYE